MELMSIRKFAKQLNILNKLVVIHCCTNPINQRYDLIRGKKQ